MAEQASISYSLCQATIFTADFRIRTVYQGHSKTADTGIEGKPLLCGNVTSMHEPIQASLRML